MKKIRKAPKDKESPYNPKMVKLILERTKGPFEVVPADPEEFLKWLNE